MKRKDSLARKGMKLLCTLLGIVLVALLGTTEKYKLPEIEKLFQQA